jgi:hypothetical protein
LFDAITYYREGFLWLARSFEIIFEKNFAVQRSQPDLRIASADMNSGKEVAFAIEGQAGGRAALSAIAARWRLDSLFDHHTRSYQRLEGICNCASVNSQSTRKLNTRDGLSGAEEP